MNVNLFLEKMRKFSFGFRIIFFYFYFLVSISSNSILKTSGKVSSIVSENFVGKNKKKIFF